MQTHGFEPVRPLSHAMWCSMSEDDGARLNKTNKKTTCTFTCQVSRFHVHCVGLGCYVFIGVGRLVVRFHHAYAIPSFLLDVLVRLYLVIVNSDCSHNCCLSHIAKTGHLKCCPYTPIISKFGKFFPESDREDFNSSNEATISTSLIHDIASDGKSELVVT